MLSMLSLSSDWVRRWQPAPGRDAGLHPREAEAAWENPQQPQKLRKLSKIKAFHHLWQQQNKSRGWALAEQTSPTPPQGAASAVQTWEPQGFPPNLRGNLRRMAVTARTDWLTSSVLGWASGRGSGAGPALSLGSVPACWEQQAPLPSAAPSAPTCSHGSPFRSTPSVKAFLPQPAQKGRLPSPPYALQRQTHAQQVEGCLRMWQCYLHAHCKQTPKIQELLRNNHYSASKFTDVMKIPAEKTTSWSFQPRIRFLKLIRNQKSPNKWPAYESKSEAMFCFSVCTIWVQQTRSLSELFWVRFLTTVVHKLKPVITTDFLSTKHRYSLKYSKEDSSTSHVSGPIFLIVWSPGIFTFCYLYFKYNKLV